MTKYLKHIFLALSLAICFNTFAVTTANDVLSKTSLKINSAKCLIANFTATVAQGKSTKGTLTIAGRKFAMTTEGYGVWFNGTDMWSYYANNKETSLTTPTDGELLEINPLMIVNQYAKNFKATITAKSKSSYTVVLTPLSKSNSVRKATIVISASTWLPTSIDATFSNNTSLMIKINSITEGKNTPAKSLFEYQKEKYPGIDVIDLR